MDENKFLEMTNCHNCPCLNRDFEEGGSCNLEYEVDLYYTEQKCSDLLIYASFDCGLEVVKYLNGEYRPTKVMARKNCLD